MAGAASISLEEVKQSSSYACIDNFLRQVVTLSCHVSTEHESLPQEAQGGVR
jgi:hypothetical protein